MEKEDRNDTWHRVERSSGKFSRRFGLPGNAKMDQIKACMEHGVLTVTVPNLLPRLLKSLNDRFNSNLIINNLNQARFSLLNIKMFIIIRQDNFGSLNNQYFYSEE